jgi:hypothetical protein
LVRPDQKVAEGAVDVMAYKNPEHRAAVRACRRKWYQENHEAILAYQKQYRLENHEAVCARKRERHIENPERAMLIKAKVRSKKAGRVFDIKLEDIKIPSHCPLLGLPLFVSGGCKGRENSPSLDRIDSAGGYTRDNIWVISSRANTIKNDATLAELEMIVDGLRRKICSVGA